MKILSTTGRATSEAIRDREDFNTHGALKGRNISPIGYYDSGRLGGADLEIFNADCDQIDYVVTSYATPIAWHSAATGWYKVEQKFSVTTSRHQGNLYLIHEDG